jgi:AAA family ATP:ADP antiporter
MFKILDYLKNERGKKIGFGVLMVGLSAMFTFAGYEMIRSPAESIFLKYYSAQEKAYALAVVPFVMFVFIYLYGRALSRFGSMRSTVFFMLFSSLALISLYFSNNIWPNKYIAFIILVFKEAYVVIISEQYWSYMDSILKNEEGKIFNGPVAGFGAMGSLIGGWFVSRYVISLKTEIYILFSALALIPALILFYFAYKDTGEPKPSYEEEGGKKGHLHLSILKENKTVLFIAIIIFSTQVVSTLFDVNFTYYVKQSLSDADMRTSYLGDFWMKVNIFSFTMQFLFTPILLGKIKIKYILLFIPIVHIASSVFIFIRPELLTASIAFLLFKGMDYSIFRAAKETLYIPFSYDTRYRAKQISDAFTYRFSKGCTSLTLSAGNILHKLSISIFPFFSLFFAAIWLLFTAKMKIEEADKA